MTEIVVGGGVTLDNIVLKGIFHLLIIKPVPPVPAVYACRQNVFKFNTRGNTSCFRLKNSAWTLSLSIFFKGCWLTVS